MTESRYSHILQAVLYEPWALKEDYYRLMCRIVQARALGISATDEEIEAAARNRREATQSVNGAIAVLPLYGLISQRASMVTDMSGGTSTEQFGAMFQQAMADPAISSIIIDIDSPGGSVFGIQELWDTMMSYRGKKPVTAVANSLAASAAYFIASAAESISVTPGGVVGSIGIVQQHDDISEAMVREGVKTTLITAGRKKATGNPFEPLSDEARAVFQDRVDVYYGMFVNAVAKGRGVNVTQVRNGYGEGDVVLAREALKLGMVDHVETLDQAIVRVARGGTRTGTRAQGEFLITNMMIQENQAHAEECSERSPANKLLERRREMLGER